MKATEVDVLRAFLIYSLENSRRLKTINGCMEAWNDMGRKAGAQLACGCRSSSVCPKCTMKDYLQKGQELFK